MALVDTTWYCNSTAYAAVTARVSGAAVTAGTIRRQFTTPAVGNERCFICIVAGTSAVATDATWVLTRGAKTTDGTVTWMECTGQAALNGDLVNTQTWAAVKAATPAVLGQIIKRSNNASYQICTTAGAMSASEPAFSDTAGVTTTDTTAVWTSLGAVGSYTGGMAPFARLAAACTTTWLAAGGTVFVSNNHAETQSTAISMLPNSSITTTTRILCHNSAGSYPPTSGNLTTGATVSTTGNSAITFTPNTAGGFYVYGVAFKSGVGASGAASLIVNANHSWLQFDACSFEVATTSASAVLQLGSTGFPGNLLLNATTVKFANVSHSITVNAIQFLWQNTGQVLVSGSSVPTTFMKIIASTLDTTVLEALDLSQLTGSLFATNDANGSSQFVVRDCKLHASATITTPLSSNAIVQLARSSA